ncbi:MAG: hypothetical protein OXU23_19775 [Candidatus Poribacteria bacterium]|nr:hypothetical protein [Candidatus Poribacteria bacterium]MDE0313519.1 hypothetical protein [Candidatus Poribacteria bacterium]
MDALKKVIGVVLIIIAAIVAIHTVIEPLYHTSAEEGNPFSSVWKYINYLSAISIVLGVIFSYARMSRSGENSSVQEFIAANTLFYGFMFAAILFFYNWFGTFGVAKDFTAVGAETRSVVWIIFDALLPLLNGALGAHLLRSNASE